MGGMWISVTKTKIVEYSWVTANFKEFLIIEVQNWALFVFVPSRWITEWISNSQELRWISQNETRIVRDAH